MRRDWSFIAALLCLTFVAFWPVGSLGFIGYDDLDYVYQNPAVRSGINPDSVAWALTTSHTGNWHPVTWLSHMLDCQLFGLNPHEAHGVNLGLHAINTVLLFVWLCGITGMRWRAFFVAALFALHPLHIQSVAWVAERKDVLSGFFFMLILLAYTRYCRNRTTGNYILVAVLVALGLMSKSMLVTVPFVLLLLDFWPLRRMGAAENQTAKNGKNNKSQNNPALPSPASGFKFEALKPLLIEKIPLFVMCLIMCRITLWAQNAAGAVADSHAIPLSNRCLHAVVAYSLYLGKMIWPTDLAIYYPLPLGAPPVMAVIGSFVLISVITLAAVWTMRRQPWILFGWLWFLAMLIPVIGLVQVGLQSIADRYVYLPSIGLFVALTWGLGNMIAHANSEPSPETVPATSNTTLPQTALAVLGVAVLLACGIDTRYQLRFWQNNITLFKHVVEVSPSNNYLGYFCLGISYGEAGDFEEAALALTNALAINPNSEMARGRMGNLCLIRTNYAAAQPFLESEVRTYPNSVVPHMTLAMALAGQHKYIAAQAEYEAALQIYPQDVSVQQTLAANTPKADAEQTVNLLTPQLDTNATPPEIYARLAQAEAELGQFANAAQHYQHALDLHPDMLEWLNNLAWILATCPEAAVRNGPQAVRLAEHACELTQHQQAIFLGTLAAAYAENGQFDDAVRSAQKACDLATAAGQSGLIETNQRFLKMYQNHQPYHDSMP